MPDPEEFSTDHQVIETIMQSLGLNDKEVEIYNKSSALGPVTVGELALIGNIDFEDCQIMVKKFVKMGLFKELLGPKQYLQALPPYVAISQQLNNFGQYLGSLKKELPKQLLESFNQLEEEAESLKRLDTFLEFLSETNANMGEKLNARRQDLEQMQKQTQTLIETQFDGLNYQIVHSLNVFDENFKEISNSLDQSVELLRGEINTVLEHLDELPAKVADEKKLFQSKKSLEESVHFLIDPEITLIKSMFQTNFLNEYQQIVDNLKVSFQDHLSTPFGEILEKGRDSFAQDFEVPFKELIENTSSKMESALVDFDSTLKEVHEKVSDLTAGIKNGFESMRGVFSDKVIQTLADLVENIQSKLDESSVVVKEFWQAAKQAITISMKDVWFIHSAQGMQAYMKDAISRIKMRLLIVAPDLTDINFDPLFELPPYINVRIVCNIIMEDPTHQVFINQISEHVNITLRNRELQNIWGINRDYEEVVVGIVSMAQDSHEDSPSVPREVVGIGSSFREHIQMLVPILEEAWVNAKKGIYTNPEPAESKEDIPGETSEETSSTENICDTPSLIKTIDSLLNVFTSLTPNECGNQLFLIHQGVINCQGYSKIVNDMETWVNRLLQMLRWDEMSSKTLRFNLESWKKKLQP